METLPRFEELVAQLRVLHDDPTCRWDRIVALRAAADAHAIPAMTHGTVEEHTGFLDSLDALRCRYRTFQTEADAAARFAIAVFRFDGTVLGQDPLPVPWGLLRDVGPDAEGAWRAIAGLAAHGLGVAARRRAAVAADALNGAKVSQLVEAFADHFADVEPRTVCVADWQARAAGDPRWAELLGRGEMYPVNNQLAVVTSSATACLWAVLEGANDQPVALAAPGTDGSDLAVRLAGPGVAEQLIDVHLLRQSELVVNPRPFRVS